MMRQFGISLLTAANILTFLGIFYYFVPGYPHLFAPGEATGSQGNLGFACIALFLLTFLTAVQLPPARQEDHESGTCWACGAPGTELQWWHVEARSRTGQLAYNQRVSYLIHSQCTYLAERQAGL